MFNVFNNGVKTAKEILLKTIEKGDIVIDATAGNGNDTLFLAKLVGNEGRVYAFDIQEEAINKTKTKLIEADEIDQVQLVQDGHENLDKYIKVNVRAAMFNLGYLPGGDHEKITRPDSTITAVNKVLDILLPGGIMTIVVYYGHDGGIEERNHLLEFIQGLDSSQFNVIRIDYPNRRNNPPFLLIIEKG